jgi:CreA protein
MPKVDRVDVAWYTVRDFERAGKFYRDVLGLKPVFGSADMGWQEFQVGEGPTHLAISRAEASSPPAGAGGGAVVVLAVGDVEQTRAELVAKDVRCEKVQVIPNVVKLCTFYDPEGNQLQLAQTVG